VRELGKQARERINADFNVEDPNTPLHAEDHVWFEDRWMVASLCDE
jgi:hypothetical protein